MSAIGIRFVPYEEGKHAGSHFFGSPILPESLLDTFDEEALFLGMIALSEIARFDPENRLPHKGYLYFFLDTSDYERRLYPLIRYSEEEPEFCIDDFNEAFAQGDYPGTDRPRGIEFYEVPEDSEGCKLLGVPCDWNYPDPPKDPLLLQLSHFDEGFDFLPHLDGYTYVFCPKDEWNKAYGFYEYS